MKRNTNEQDARACEREIVKCKEELDRGEITQEEHDRFVGTLTSNVNVLRNMKKPH